MSQKSQIKEENINLNQDSALNDESLNESKQDVNGPLLKKVKRGKTQNLSKKEIQQLSRIQKLIKQIQNESGSEDDEDQDLWQVIKNDEPESTRKNSNTKKERNAGSQIDLINQPSNINSKSRNGSLNKKNKKQKLIDSSQTSDQQNQQSNDLIDVQDFEGQNQQESLMIVSMKKGDKDQVYQNIKPAKTMGEIADNYFSHKKIERFLKPNEANNQPDSDKKNPIVSRNKTMIKQISSINFKYQNKNFDNGCDINIEYRGGKGVDYIRKICHAVMSDEKKRFQQGLKQLEQYLEEPYKQKLEFLVQKYLNIQSDNVVQLSKYVKILINKETTQLKSQKESFDMIIEKELEICQKALKYFSNQRFEDIPVNDPNIQFQVLIQIAFINCIYEKELNVAYDFIIYSKSHVFSLPVNYEIIDFLLGNNQFYLIDKMLKGHVLLQQNDVSHSNQIKKNFDLLVEKAFFANVFEQFKQLNFMKYVLSKEDNLDKYIKLSDFMIYLTDYLLAIKRQKVLKETQEKLQKIILDLVYQLLIIYQDHADYETIMLMSIQNEIHQYFINQVDRKTFNYVQLCVKACRKDTRSPFEDQIIKVTNPKEIKDQNLNQFIYDNYQTLSEENRLKTIKALLISSLTLQSYFLTQVVLKKFLAELIGPNLIPFLIILKQQLKKDSSKYEMKLEILCQVIPYLSKNQMQEFVRVLDCIMNEPPANSIFKKNINPLRLGTIFFSVLEQIQEQYTQFVFSCDQMKASLLKQLFVIFETYHQPDELIPMIEELDYNGQSVQFYMNRYELFEVLQTKIMDRFFSDKWEGRLELRNDIFDFSTSYYLIKDEFGFFQTDEVISLLIQQVFNQKKLQFTHIYQFESWKRSMMLRNAINLIITFILTIIFQYQILFFIQSLHDCRSTAFDLLNWSNAGNVTSHPYYVQNEEELYVILDLDLFYHDVAMYFSILVYLPFPLKLMSTYYFVGKTQRKKIGFTMNDIVELALSISVAVWVYFRFYLSSNDWVANSFMYYDQNFYTSGQYFIFNVIWLIQCDIQNYGPDANGKPYYYSTLTSFRFDFLLAIVGAFVWIKLFLQFKYLKTFGFLFVIIQNILKQTLKLVIVWGLEIIVFNGVAYISLNQNIFYTFTTSLQYWLMCIFGNWNYSNFMGPTITWSGQPANNQYYLGCIVQTLFLCINNVLMFNLLIAILGNIYGGFQNIKNGLFYDQLIEVMPENEWNDYFGIFACNYVPFLLFSPIQIIMFQITQFAGLEAVKKLNHYLCLIIYIPLSIIFFLMFIVLNIIMVFYSLVSYSQILFRQIFFKRTFKDQMNAFLGVFRFIFVGGPILILSIFFDAQYFYKNLFNDQIQQNVDVVKNFKIFAKEDLILFEEICVSTLKKLRKKHKEMKLKGEANFSQIQNEFGGYQIKFQEINKQLQTKFELYRHLQNLVFVRSIEEKFVYSKDKNLYEIKPEYIDKIKHFTFLKNLVVNSSEIKTGYVDVSMLKSFIDQVKMKLEIFNSGQQNGIITTDKTEEQFFQQISFEFLNARPGIIEQQLFNTTLQLQQKDIRIDKIRNKLISLESKLEETYRDYDKLQQLSEWK